MEFIKALREETERARRIAAEAKMKYELVRDALKAYEASRSTTSKRAAQQSRSESKRVVGGTRRNVNKTSLIQSIVLDSHASGIAPEEILTALKKRRVSISKNAIFSALSKLKQRRLVTAKNGKYYPAERLLKSESPQSKVNQTS